MSGFRSTAPDSTSSRQRGKYKAGDAKEALNCTFLKWKSLASNEIFPSSPYSIPIKETLIRSPSEERSIQNTDQESMTINISGMTIKRSMKNDFRGKNLDGDPLKISILPTLMVTAMAKTKMGATCSSEYKNDGDLIYARA